MADATKTHQGINSAAPTEDLLKIAQAIVDLHIARRNFLIYPETHEQVLRSLDRAFGRLAGVLAQQPEITVVVHKQGLAVGKTLLSSKTSVFKDLSAVLKQYQIATLTFSQGLEKDELVRFLGIIVTEREKILSKGGIGSALAHADLAHIHVQVVDYRQLQITEESQISRDQGEPKEAGSIWQQFVAQMPHSGPQAGDNRLPDASLALDPEKLAALLNDQAMDVSKAVAQYESIFKAACILDDQQQSIPDGLPQFQQMIKNLNPDLQRQFLAATFDQCGQLATMTDTANLIDGLGGDLIIQMILQASEDHKKISPSLLFFLEKMGLLGAPAPMPGSGSQKDELASSEIKTLLAHEQYDKFVDQGYDEFLAKMTSRQLKETSKDATHQIQSEIEDSLLPDRIHSHVGHAMLALMRNSRDLVGYRSWARQLAYLLDDLLESHAFEFMTEIMNFFSVEKECGDPEKAKIAGLVLDRFNDPQFVARAVEIFYDFGHEVDPKAMRFLVGLGEPVVVEIFETLDPNETFMEGGNLSAKLLNNLAALTAQEAVARLDDPRPEYVCRMIRIISRLGDSASADQVRPLLEHADMEIRMEALSALLKFRNKWGFVRLRDLLEDPSAPDFYGAIQLAGQHRVTEAVPRLTAYAERSGDMVRQEAALRALGRIGDPSVIPILSKLAHRRWGVSKKNRHHIKRVVFETLEGYPRAEIQALVHFGLKQEDGVIRSSCEQVIRKWMTQ